MVPAPLQPDQGALARWRARHRRATILALGLRADPPIAVSEVEAVLPEGEVLLAADPRLAFIGQGPPPFDRLVLVRFRGPDALDRAVTRLADGPLAARVDGAQAWAVRELALPRAVRWLFRALRAVGGVLGYRRARPGDVPGEGPLYPTAAQQAALQALPPGDEALMVNWLAFPDREGARVYQRYGRVAVRNIHLMGGGVAFLGRIEATLRDDSALTGGVDWDQLAIMRYPRLDLFASLPSSPGYAAAAELRARGLSHTVLLIARQVA